MPADIARSTAPLLRAALIKRAHGVGGEVRAEPLGQDPSRFRAGLRLIREDNGEVITVKSARAADGDVLLTFVEAAEREAVDALRGVYLCVERGEARKLGPDEWFVTDLVGLRAVTTEGEDIGIVSDIEQYPAHDVIVVGVGKAARRFPMVKEFVADVDLGAGTVTLTPWEEI